MQVRHSSHVKSRISVKSKFALLFAHLYLLNNNFQIGEFSNPARSAKCDRMKFGCEMEITDSRLNKMPEKHFVFTRVRTISIRCFVLQALKFTHDLEWHFICHPMQYPHSLIGSITILASNSLIFLGSQILYSAEYGQSVLIGNAIWNFLQLVGIKFMHSHNKGVWVESLSAYLNIQQQNFILFST